MHLETVIFERVNLKVVESFSGGELPNRRSPSSSLSFRMVITFSGWISNFFLNLKKVSVSLYLLIHE